MPSAWPIHPIVAAILGAGPCTEGDADRCIARLQAIHRALEAYRLKAGRRPDHLSALLRKWSLKVLRGTTLRIFIGSGAGGMAA
jgi:hypothetical protein